jgi:hypothetical protein
VHITGQTTNELDLEDKLLGVSVANSARLERIVEMYQYQEYEEGLDEESG